EDVHEPLWEVFIRSRRGLAHNHVGSLHAPDAQMALRNARDVFTRRMEGISIWVVPSAAITATSPEERDPFFEPAADKAYRHPTFYDIPKGGRQVWSPWPQNPRRSMHFGMQTIASCSPIGLRSGRRVRRRS